MLSTLPLNMSDRNSASGERNPSRPSGSPPRRPTPRVFEFIDSQDPNTRRTIQRHTANHTAARRREARIGALQETAQPRNWEWRRRTRADHAASSLTARVSANPSGSDTPGPASNLSAQPSHHTEHLGFPLDVDQSYGAFEEAMLQNYLSASCQHPAHRRYYERLAQEIRRDPASANLLIGYIQANGLVTSPELNSEVEQALACRGRGYELLTQRLSEARQASSDINIQAVLILFTNAHRSGSAEEARIHFEGLSRMVRQRRRSLCVEYLQGDDAVKSDRLSPARRRAQGEHVHTIYLTLQCPSPCANQAEVLPELKQLFDLEHTESE